RLREELEAILVDRHATQIPKSVLGVRDSACASTEQIEIARSPMRLVAPDREEQGALQNVLIAVCRTAQPIQEPFQGIASEDPLEVLSPIARQVEQALAH